MTKKRLTGQGGPGRGQGRKPAPPDEVLHVVAIRMTRSDRTKLKVLGGLPWVRDKVSRAKQVGSVDTGDPQTRQREPSEDTEMIVASVRLNNAQRAKFFELGSGAWLRARIRLARGKK